MKKIICIISAVLSVLLIIIPLYCSDRNYYRDLSNGDTADIFYGNRAYNDDRSGWDNVNKYSTFSISLYPASAEVWTYETAYDAIFSYNIKSIHKELKLSEPEYVFILKIIDMLDYEKMDWNDRYNEAYDGIEVMFDKRDGSTDSDWSLNKNTFQKCTAIFLLESILYVKMIYPLWTAVYLVFAIIIVLVFKKYADTRELCFNSAVRLVWHKTTVQRRFLLSAFVPLLFSLMLKIKYVSIYMEKLLETVKFDLFYVIYDKTDTYNIAQPIYGINIYSWLIITVFEILILYKMTKDKRLISAFSAGTFIQMLLQRFVFLSLLGKHRDPKGQIITFFNKIGLIEPIKYHSKVVVFLLFFLIGIIVYFIAGIFSEKNKYKNLSWSAAFSAVNSVMCCLPVYILNFWCFTLAYYFINIF